MIVNVYCGLGEYPVELGDITVQDLPKLIATNNGIVVPIESDGENRLFIPAAQIQGISWFDVGIVGDVAEEIAEDVAEVSYIGEGEPDVDQTNGDRGENGEVFLDE
jgi:hypothetical protein